MNAAVASLIGVVLGAFLSPFAVFMFAKRQEAFERKRDAYLKFMRAVAAASNLKSEEAVNDAAVLLREANLQVCLYGSAHVIREVQLTMRYQSLKNADAQDAFLKVVTAMRSDVGSHRFGDHEPAMRDILFLERKI